jgi:hypothetical protein
MRGFSLCFSGLYIDAFMWEWWVFIPEMWYTLVLICETIPRSTHQERTLMTTLADLLTTLETHGALPASRAKDCKTSLKYLATALGHPSLAQCPVDVACRDPGTWLAALETHFAALTAQGRTISGATARNTRHNVRTVFRLAEAHGLLKEPLPSQLLPRPRRDRFLRQQALTTPYASTYRPQTGPRHYGLPQEQWPPDIQDGWRTYLAKCGHRLRERTLRSYTNYLATYLGYIGSSPPTQSVRSRLKS